jgi:hypothetical protein
VAFLDGLNTVAKSLLTRELRFRLFVALEEPAVDNYFRLIENA